MKISKVFLGLLLIAVGFAAGLAVHGWKPQRVSPNPKERKILYWQDPMHPAYKSDKPGIAPDCGMQLVPVYAESAAGPAHAEHRKVLYYHDPHQPSYRAENPGMNPETGNDLVPVYEGDSASMPPGTVQITAEKQQLLGVRFGTVEYTSASKTVRASGSVAVDERRIAQVHTRVEGWIDKVFADYTGKFVEKGQPLFTLYSPEMLATEQEYLLALKARGQLGKSTLEGMPDHMNRLVSASRRRLELWDLSEAQIEEIGRTGNPIRTITIYAPASGHITERLAFPNLQVKPEMNLYTIVDLSRVWILASVFEADAAMVRAGMSAIVSPSYGSGAKFRAQVTFVQPKVDVTTRTMQVRLEAENPRLALKPDMYVEVEFAMGGGPRLSVPSEAVLDSGDRQTVFVDRGNGFLEPRPVEIGERLDDRIEIRKGLQAGERIVVSGNFLIDSESRLKPAVDGMSHKHD